MSDPSLEMQAAIVAALQAADLGAGIYDTARADASFPYITLGDGQVLPDKADGIDGAELFLQVDVWSRAVGFPEAKTIAKGVIAALDDQPITVTGQDVIVFEHQETRYLRDPDGLTRHAAITFRSLVFPT